MKSKIILGLGGALLSAMALVALTPAAQADEGACPVDSFCLFEHDNYEGGRAVFGGTDGDLRDNRWVGGSGGTVNDEASSMINNTGREVVLHLNVECTNPLEMYTAIPESFDRDLSNNVFDNKVSCVRFT